ncbi:MULTISPECIES: hypothetical protein [unclassified Paraburkholderia]|uniref:hypothetical protein n=1 Tax=unclassified Paraburkholderia TaxID=2615204 RepID=UPI00160AB208|nr:MULTISPECIES: hypothetical protein [unclassified Paraburkholderia]MBB5447236.1 hypothetical protein [Paraburkholderia sp. WSM4177]MBB5487776.1 hypothetical protein [Paraburkholderia sp. WSM4180]
MTPDFVLPMLGTEVRRFFYATFRDRAPFLSVPAPAHATSRLGANRTGIMTAAA